MALIGSNIHGGYFNGYVTQRIRNNRNFIAAVTGPTGSGKSYSVLKLAESLDPEFNADNICFTATQFMALINGKVKKLHKGSNILFDEIQVTLGHLDFQSIQAKLLNYVLQTFRHRNFVLWVTTPHFSFINASARKLFHCRMETLSIDKEQKQVTLKPFLIQINQKRGEIYEKYLRVWSKEYGIVPLKRIKVGLPSKKLVDAYETKKTEFTQKLNESIANDLERIDGGAKKYRPLTRQQQQIVEMLKEGSTIYEVAKEMNRSEQLIYQQLALIGKKGITLKAIKDGKKVLRYEVLGNVDN